MPVPDDFDPNSVDPESLLIPKSPPHSDPFIQWLLEHANEAGLGNSAGRPYITVVGALAVEKGMTTPMVEQLSTLLDVDEDEIWAKHRELGYGKRLD